MNPLLPERMSAAERLDEIAAILATGFIRLKTRQSRKLSARPEKSLVDFAGHRSRHGATNAGAEN
ncbi:hypothetical protein [Aquamicrobium terrae]|uniref:Uncharacterized protein n=1 Tax=Aquamicrobium terrae TaxID=1324945 RepID=A0ABV2MYC2_9HYPH